MMFPASSTTSALFRQLELAIKKRDEESLPLLLDTLIRKEGPQSLKMKNVLGCTLLHDACLYGVDPLTIQTMIAASPESVSIVSSYQETPLHWAVRRRAPSDHDESSSSSQQLKVIQMLLEANPTTAVIVDDAGDTPLHDACGNHRNAPSKASLQVVEFMVHSCPVSCLLLNNCNKLPIDHAAATMGQQQHGGNRKADNAVLHCITQTTMDAAHVLLRIAFHAKCHIPKPVERHLLLTISGWTRQQGPFERLSQSVLRSNLAYGPSLKQLLRNKHVQNLLHDPSYQCLINGMVGAERTTSPDSAAQKKEDELSSLSAVLLERMSCNPDCLWMHLVEHPSALVSTSSAVDACLPAVPALPI